MPVRLMAGQQPLELHIGIRVPDGQPIVTERLQSSKRVSSYM